MKVAFYDFQPKDAAGIDSIEIARNWVNGHEPTLTYLLNVPSINCPSDGADLSSAPLNTTMGDFLLGHREFAKRVTAAKGDTKVLPERLSAPVGPRAIFVFTGFVNIRKSGTYTISVPCDDGDETSIGGVVVHTRPNFGGINPDPDSAENVGRAEFTSAGIYPIKVIHYDRDPGSSGLHVFSDVDPKGERHANGRVLLPLIQSK